MRGEGGLGSGVKPRSGRGRPRFGGRRIPRFVGFGEKRLQTNRQESRSVIRQQLNYSEIRF